MKNIPFDLKTYVDFEGCMLAHREAIIVSDNIDQTNTVVAWFIRHHCPNTMLIHFHIHASHDLENGYGIVINTCNAINYPSANNDEFECYIFDGYSCFMNHKYIDLINRIRMNDHAFIIFICRDKDDLIINSQIPAIFKIPTHTMSTKEEWSEDEDKFLLDFYPILGPIGCAAYINDAREIECYRRYTYIYGEKINNDNPKEMNNNGNDGSADNFHENNDNDGSAYNFHEEDNHDAKLYWSDIDDEFFNRRWDDLGPEIITLFPGKTYMQCLEHAMELNLIKEKSGPWTDIENKIMMRFYPSLGSSIMKYLPGRTEPMIREHYYSVIQQDMIDVDELDIRIRNMMAAKK